MQTHVQDYFDNGILQPVDELFEKWSEKADYFPSVRRGDAVEIQPSRSSTCRTRSCRTCSTTGPTGSRRRRSLPGHLCRVHRRGPQACQASERIGYALRGGDYFGLQVIEPIWASAGVKFVDESGKVDFDSADAVAVTEQWVGMYTKDKSAQANRRERPVPQLFALMEGGKAAMWIYGVHGASPARHRAGRGSRPSRRRGSGTGPSCWPTRKASC